MKQNANHLQLQAPPANYPIFCGLPDQAGPPSPFIFGCLGFSIACEATFVNKNLQLYYTTSTTAYFYIIFHTIACYNMALILKFDEKRERVS